MKNILFLLGAVLSLASCQEISTDPAPARATRTAQTVTVTYARTASTILNDTTLQNPRLEVYVVTPTTNADGSFSYPNITGAAPAFTITDFATPQPITIATNLTVTENTPSTGIRLVLSTSNRPGRRTTPANPANAQRLTASILVNGAVKTTLIHQGTNFSRTAGPTAGLFTTAVETNVAAFTF